MRKKWLLVFLISTFCYLHLPAATAQAAKQVPVTLPDFSVTLDGVSYCSDYSKYPLLVYNNITYFPMTYYDSRLMALNVNWMWEGGLVIDLLTEQDFGNPAYYRELTTQKNAQRQSALISTKKITVNGTPINNQAETYPLLEFRDITYFPLTWRFAVKEFGWTYTFDAQNGLCIESPMFRRLQYGEQTWFTEPWRAIDGVGNLPLALAFIAKEQTATPNEIIGGHAPDTFYLYNRTGQDITLLPYALDDWRYEVYQLIGKREELIFSQIIPFYQGEIPAQHLIRMPLGLIYWDTPHTKEGVYRVAIKHPDTYNYRIAGRDAILTAPVAEGTGDRFWLSGKLTIREK